MFFFNMLVLLGGVFSKIELEFGLFTIRSKLVYLSRTKTSSFHASRNAISSHLTTECMPYGALLSL